MHDTALELGRRFFEAYGSNLRDQRILDVGSMDVNGSLRSVASPSDEYTGLDIEPGPGVDVVEASGQLPFEDESFDLVVSTSCLEHDMLFWATFEQMLRVLKRGGYLYLNVPSNGKYHGHPFDCWRFYPDSGIALELWARKCCGISCWLMESFVYDQGESEWNDCVLVFRKGRPGEDRPWPISDSDPRARNVRLFDQAALGNGTEPAEDQRRELQARQTSEHLWQGRRDDDALRSAEGYPFFTVIVAYYQGCTTNAAFERFLLSLDAQRYRDFEVLIYHDGPLLEPVVCPYAIVATPERTAQWGHDLRAQALLRAKGTYILHTNADNEYAPDAFGELARTLQSQPMDVAVCECDMVGLVRHPETGVLSYDNPRDPEKVVRFTGNPPRLHNVDLMQVAIRRSVWTRYGFVGRDPSADGRLIERMATERGFGALPILMGRHY